MADKLIISYVNFNLTMRHWLSITFKASFKARWTNPIFSCRKLYPITPHNISVYHKPDLMVHRASEKKNQNKTKKKEKKNFSKFNEYTCYTSKYFILFSSKLASGRNPPNPAIWLVPRAGSFLRSCPLTRAESLAALFTSLFVVCEWAKPVIFNHFSFKTCAIISVS